MSDVTPLGIVVPESLLGELTKRGKQRGFLTTGEIQQELEEIGALPIAFEHVVEVMRAAKVRIVEDEIDDDLPGINLDEEALSLTDPVKMYLQEIGRVPLLTGQQEVELAMRVEAKVRAEAKLAAGGDLSDEDRALLEREVKQGARAQTRLVEANLRLVVSIAKRYVGRGMGLLDLVQEGNLGLMRAVDRFDYRKGFKFSTYATWWIRQAVTRALADEVRTIRVPVHIAETINTLIRAQRALHQDLGREPTIDEIAQEMEVEPGRVTELRRIAQDPVSLETPLGAEDDSTIGDFVQDTDAEVPVEAASFRLLQDYLAQTLEELSDREREVLILRYGLDGSAPRTLEEVGGHFHITRERVRQIEHKALAKLRHPQRRARLEGYLGSA